MSDRSAIQWTDASWNPTRGCSRVSEGCRHCYAEVVAARFSTPALAYAGLTTRGKWNGMLRLVEEHLEDPLRWRRPRRIFVDSMSDLFHEKVPVDWIAQVFNVMADARAEGHTFQVLTKRPERMRVLMGGELADYVGEHYSGESPLSLALEVGPGAWPLPNIWLGVSAEDQATADERIPFLLQTPAAARWVSYEPALGPVDFSPWVRRVEYSSCQNRSDSKTRAAIKELARVAGGKAWGPSLDWLVVGGESGPGARPFNLAWARSAIAQCRAAGVPVFVKQLGAHPIYYDGGRNPACTLRLCDRKGGDPAEWPADLRVREYPK